MNVERVKAVLEHLKALPDKLFDYAKLLDHDFDNPEQPPICGTVGCVAGHTCLLYFKEFQALKHDLAYSGSAQVILGISSADQMNLFFEFCGQANKDDAIMRLEWLLKHGSLDEYVFENESHRGLC